MIWYKNDEEDFLIEIPFAMESEWKYNDVQYDFEKLLQSDAKLKLMICCFNNDRDQHEYLKGYFSKALEKYSNQKIDSRYMIAILQDWKPFKFNYYYYDFSISKNFTK